MKRKMFFLVLGAIALPLILDFFVFGNNFSSNIDNAIWAAFFGSYIGGIATMAAVYISIEDNKKNMEEQNKNIEEQKKNSIRPYLDAGIYLDKDVSFSHIDMTLEGIDGKFEKLRYNLHDTEKNIILARSRDKHFVCLRYAIRNLGAASALDVKVVINDFSIDLAMAKDEKINVLCMIDLKEKKEIPLKVEMRYWDIMHTAQYYQNVNTKIYIDSKGQHLEKVERTYPVEI